MKWILLVASLVFLVCLVPSISIAQEPDFDSDGVEDAFDNCSIAVNTGQDDTDGDFCGNLCDADYDNSGIVGFSDFGRFANNCFAFPGEPDELVCHVEPIPNCTCGFADFGFFAGAFGKAPGPSGTTPGTTACP
jgi:hypothetical protein